MSLGYCKVLWKSYAFKLPLGRRYIALLASHSKRRLSNLAIQGGSDIQSISLEVDGLVNEWFLLVAIHLSPFNLATER